MRIQHRKVNRIGGNKFATSKTKIREALVKKGTNRDKTPENVNFVTTTSPGSIQGHQIPPDEILVVREKSRGKIRVQSANQDDKCRGHCRGIVDSQQGRLQSEDGTKPSGGGNWPGGEEPWKSKVRGITHDDMKVNVFAARINIFLHVWPYIFDKETGKINVNRSNLAEYILTGWFTLSRIQYCQAAAQTLYYLLNMEDWEKEILRISLIVMINLVVVLLADAYSHVLAKQRDTYIVVHNTLVEFDAHKKTGSSGDGSNTTGSEWTLKSSIRSIRSRPFRQTFLIFLPILTLPAALIVNVMQVVDPTNPILLSSLYHLIKPELEIHWTTSSIGYILYACLLICDTFAGYFNAFIVYIGAYFILLFQQKAVEMADTTIERLENHIQSGLARQLGIQNACSNLNELYLVIRLFNECYCRVVYICKLVALLAAILGGFGVILALRFEQYGFGIILGGFFLEGLVQYTVLFGPAYQLTDRVEDMKLAILVESGQLPGGKLLKARYTRFLRAIPVLGIQDGGFGLMDRLVTFNFTDFVFSQLIDLVLTFT